MNTPLVVGNWKMHGSQAECAALARQIVRALGKQRGQSSASVVIAPPFTALTAAARAIKNSSVGLAAQNCHWEERGAFTGEVSPVMLSELGCGYVILGHSERRHIFHETDLEIQKRLGAALRAGMRAILCVGETLDERQSGQTFKVIGQQLRIALKGMVKDGINQVEIAYEPVWAIGTGQNATSTQVAQVHKRIRQALVKAFGSDGETVRILYGGSVKPENAKELADTPDVAGFLVGGASLKVETFMPIVRAFSHK
ncbi:MAG: triose-phosphate isomerase [Deltaproteobacteria bacterium]|nr:triose-phosphate isomerase [Deltaproteobacteria bacterium]